MPLSQLKIRWGYLVAFLLLLISYFLIFYILGLQINESKSVTHSHTIINNLQSIKAEITDAETGVRGFAIAKDSAFLSPYESGSTNVVPLFAELRALTSDNKDFRPKVDLLGTLIHRRLEVLAGVVRELKSNGVTITNGIIAKRATSKNVMDSIRLIVNELREGEQTLMNARNLKLNSFITGTEVITIVSLLIALLTITYSVMVYSAGNKAREAADRQAKMYSQQLEDRVKELDRLNIELQELKSMEKFTSTGRIARTIAHEVRNPLTNISLAAEQLKMFSENNSEADVLLNMINRNSVRINQLVSDLLNSTRFAQLEFGKADVNEILDETLQLAADRIELKKVSIKKHYSKNLCQVPVDREKIRLAFLNIIVNALEAVQNETGVLTITTYQQGDRCIIEITDNGIGMDEDTLQKLFDPYFSVKPKGNGLGLTNTQNIILNHKGTIKVKSRKEKGTTFTIALLVDQ